MSKSVTFTRILYWLTWFPGLPILIALVIVGICYRIIRFTIEAFI